jgi:Cof subfamily protein (haloacid dehalogenase superfamily)
MKLFVTDIDDTLSVGETVSEKVKAACRRLKENGWEIMVATGRTFGTAKNHMKAASVTQPAILYDGARIMSVRGEEMHSSFLDAALVEKLLAVLWTWPIEIQLAGDEIVHCRESDVETALFYRNAGVPVYYVTGPHPPGPVYRIGLWIRPEKLSSVEREIKALFGGLVEVISGGAEFLDILPKGVSKGKALARFIAGLPERPEIIVAAGDHNNDLEMLRCADIAVVPSNANLRHAADNIADIIMPRAAEHGIDALVKHILSPAFSSQTRKGNPQVL